MKATVLPGGLTAKPINPFSEDILKGHYMTFEKQNPPLPLTTQQPENEVIECEDDLVWQFIDPADGEWTDEGENAYKRFATFSDYNLYHSKLVFGDEIKTRTALKPIVQPITTKGSPTLDEMVAHTMGRMPSVDGLDSATNGKEELIHKGDYDRLPESERVLYKVQYQEWKSGWVDCNDKPYEVVGHVRVMYRLISSVVSAPSRSGSENLDQISERLFKEFGFSGTITLHTFKQIMVSGAQWQQSKSEQIIG